MQRKNNNYSAPTSKNIQTKTLWVEYERVNTF